MTSKVDRHETGTRLSLVPAAAGDTVEELGRAGVTVPSKVRDYVLSQVPELSPDHALMLHEEYLRELFGIFGDGSKLLCPSVPEALNHRNYVSPDLQELRVKIDEQLSKLGLPSDRVPRWQRVLDPYARAHWFLALNEDVDVRQRYRSFTESLDASRLNGEHTHLADLVDYSTDGSAWSVGKLYTVLTKMFQSGGVFQRDNARSTRKHIAFSCGLDQHFDLACIFEETDRAFDRARGVLKPALRLVEKSARRVTSQNLEGFIFEVPINDIAPGMYVYNRIRSEDEIAVGLAANVLISEHLAAAFHAVFGRPLSAATSA